jgi:hypothetical protein
MNQSPDWRKIGEDHEQLAAADRKAQQQSAAPGSIRPG